MRLVITLVMLLASSTVCLAASFDCTQAKGRIDKLVCSNKDLSTLDEQVSVVYSRNLAMASNLPHLKDSQRRWLRDDRNSCTEVSCVMAAYKKRLQELERISGPFAQMPDSEFVRELCGQLAAAPTREQILQKPVDIIDINYDGRQDTVNQCFGGTMNTPCEDYFDSDGSQMTIKQMGFEWKDYWTYGLRMFRYFGRTYFLHSRDDDMRELSYLSYITPKNEEHVFCDFDSTVVSVIEKQSTDDDQVCEETIRPSSSIQAIKLSETIETAPEALNREATTIGHTGLVDINNDGWPDKIVDLLFASGVGRGCSFNYYEVLNNRGDALSGDLKRTRFLEMQGVDENGYDGERSCGGISNRLFQYQGKIYYEHNIDNKEGVKHTISQLRGSTTKSVCEYGREIRTKVYPRSNRDMQNLPY